MFRTGAGRPEPEDRAVHREAVHREAVIRKILVREDRPCRGLETIAACPEAGGWSFPSNHSVIAAAAAGTLVLAWRALAPFVLPLAVLMAFSRVFAGVHYPHDVAAGFLMGATLAPLVVLLLIGAVTPLVRRLGLSRAS